MLVRKGSRIVRTEASVPGEADIDMDKEMVFVVQNTRSLYNQMMNLVNNLVKKSSKGTELNVDRLSSSSVIDQMVRDALKEYDRLYGDRTVISTATRRAAKKELADYILALVDDRI